MVGHGKRVGLVDVGLGGGGALAVVQGLDAVVLLGEIGEVEVRREGARHHRLFLGREALGELVGVPEALVLLARAGGARHTALVGGNEVGEELVEVATQLRRVLREDLAQQTKEKLHVVAQALGKLHPREGLRGSGLGLGTAQGLPLGGPERGAHGGMDGLVLGTVCLKA